MKLNLMTVEQNWIALVISQKARAYFIDSYFDFRDVRHVVSDRNESVMS